MLLHVVEETFSMLLLFLLDMLQVLPDGWIDRLENGGVVRTGNVFFGHQQVAEHHRIVLVRHTYPAWLQLHVNPWHPLSLGLLAGAGAHVRFLTLEHLINGVIVLLFLSGILIEQLLELLVLGLLGVVLIFLDTDLFMGEGIL